ncbi:oxidoreductase [Consotaella salsifontis]|nr:oxidoreductase [Consotaella salsifontis]
MRSAAEAYRKYGSITAAARALGLKRQTFRSRLHRAAECGMCGTDPVIPGFSIRQVSTTEDAEGRVEKRHIQQRRASGQPFTLPAGMALKGVTALVDADGRVIHKHVMARADADRQAAVFAAATAALKDGLPRIAPTDGPPIVIGDLLNLYAVTDNHFGMLAWREETGSDYDLRIAERLLVDWFAAAIETAPQAHTAVLAQIGDLMHHDALESVTPLHRHVLDADSRLQKVIRIVIRTIRRVIDMLLQRHRHVHIIMASGNHDPASSAWLREMLAAMYETETRVSVDNSPSLYYAYEWGSTALFFHHGHRRGIGNVDATLAGQFREIFGRSRHAYAHIGHLHSDEGRKSALMYVERHETLAAPDAFAAGGGWLSGRSAKVITYHRDHGEVFRSTLRPEMVAGAANDNNPAGEMAA